MTTRKARRIRTAVVAVNRWMKVTEEAVEREGSWMENILDLSARMLLKDILRMPYGAKVLERKLLR